MSLNVGQHNPVTTSNFGIKGIGAFLTVRLTEVSPTDDNCGLLNRCF